MATTETLLIAPMRDLHSLTPRRIRNPHQRTSQAHDWVAAVNALARLAGYAWAPCHVTWLDSDSGQPITWTDCRVLGVASSAPGTRTRTGYDLILQAAQGHQLASVPLHRVTLLSMTTSIFQEITSCWCGAPGYAVQTASDVANAGVVCAEHLPELSQYASIPSSDPELVAYQLATVDLL